MSPIANEYATLVELKTHLNITTTTNDTELSAKLTAASRRIDEDTGRPHGFWVDSVTSARIYKPTHAEILLVDDISTATGLVVETGSGSTYTTLPSTYYEPLPENSLADGQPIEAIRRVIGCWYLGYGQRVRVTAKWGWPSTPDPIKAACLLLATRLFRRKDSPEGITANTDYGVVRVSRYDSDYENLIRPYIRIVM